MMREIYRNDAEPISMSFLFSVNGFRYLICHFKYQMYGTPVPAFRRLSSGTSFNLMSLLRSLIPTGKIRGQLVKIPDFVLNDNLSSGAVSKKKTSLKSSPQSGKNENIHPNETKRLKKRHSLPVLSPSPEPAPGKPFENVSIVVEKEEVEEAKVPRSRNKSVVHETPLPSPSAEVVVEEIIKSAPAIVDIQIPAAVPQQEAIESILEATEEAEFQVQQDYDYQKRRQTVDHSLESNTGSIQLKFAEYFNSQAKSVAEEKPPAGAIQVPQVKAAEPRVTSATSLEKKLFEGDLTPPPGFGSRRTKSVAPHHSHSALHQSSAPPAPVNPHPVVITAQPQTAYRRPTGTFATKGYIATNAAVFAARASPVPDNLPPVEQRAQNFFEQRKKILEKRDSLPASPVPSRTSSPAPVSQPQPDKMFSLKHLWEDDETVGGDGGRVFTSGSSSRHMLFSRRNTAGAVGAIGSRPSSVTPSEERKSVDDGGADGEEHFSLFNMDLFRSTMSPFHRND